MNFKPAWWLPGGHSQTLWRKFTFNETLSVVRERIELADGDFIDLDWSSQTTKKSETTASIVVLLHGLCGCSGSPYIIALQTKLAAVGITSVAMNFRGCSGELNRLARAYHSGVSDDLQAIFEHLRIQFPQTQFHFVGYSLGANVLLKWLGENGAQDQVAGAVAVSTPFNLAQCSNAMLKGVSQIYGRYFLRQLTQDFQSKITLFETTANQEELKKLYELKQVGALKTLWDFDDHITAPLHGFKDANHYYDSCSSATFIDSIETPTLLIHSSNDPLIPESAIPKTRTLPSSVSLELYRKGGHVGFISGTPDNWLEQRICHQLLS